MAGASGYDDERSRTPTPAMAVRPEAKKNNKQPRGKEGEKIFRKNLRFPLTCHIWYPILLINTTGGTYGTD